MGELTIVKKKKKKWQHYIPVFSFYGYKLNIPRCYNYLRYRYVFNIFNKRTLFLSGFVLSITLRSFQASKLLFKSIESYEKLLLLVAVQC